jgi:hypothetical protein
VHTTYLVVVYRVTQQPVAGGRALGSDLQLGKDLQWVAKRSLGDLPLSTTAKKALILLGKINKQ